MLKRKATKDIKKWVESKDRKCLVVQGARQTGTVNSFSRQQSSPVGRVTQIFTTACAFPLVSKTAGSGN